MENEQIYFDVLANLFIGPEAVGGKLKITDRRLVFKSHDFNIQTGTIEILIEQIAEVIAESINETTKAVEQVALTAQGQAELSQKLNVLVLKFKI